MRLLSAEVDNFSSYKHLRFEFEFNGLTLISGPTGSGKSTLCDVIPWVLWGRTAKNGAVDEVRSWGETESTDGTIKLLVNDTCYYVRRLRGKTNDLFYGPATDYIAEGKRGKDLVDTQKLINELIGMDLDTYLMGSYYHEFSQVASFFTTTAKVRRTITEQLADLSLAKNLQEKTSAYNKELKKELSDLKQEALLQQNTLQHLERQYQIDEEKLKAWYDKQAQTINELISNANNYDKKRLQTLEELFFESNMHEQEKKDKIEDIQSRLQNDNKVLKSVQYYTDIRSDLTNKINGLKKHKCSECGAAKNTDQIMLLDKELYKSVRDEEENIKTQRRIIDLGILLNKTHKQTNPYTNLIDQEKARKNTYKEQVEEIQAQENPFIKSQESASSVIKTSQYTLKSTQALIDELLVEQADIDLLTTIVDEFRGVIISNNVQWLETNTNRLLNDYFDAELRVRFNVQEADKLEVEIMKDGHICTFTQLSKGQRQILKLCFAMSVMQAVSNHKGVSFNCVFLDEALDGLDENMKIKAYGLLESLNYDSVFCVEHSESFKQLFINKIEVRLVNDKSEIEKS